MPRNNGTIPLFPEIAPASDPPKLRTYQSRGIQTLRNRYREGKTRILLVSPTGSGKTTIIAALIRTSTVPVVFVAHRMELIDQCVDDLRKVGITNVGVIRGDDKRTNPNATVQVASLQTLSRRDKPPAGILIIDEAHRSLGDGYLALIAHYREQGTIVLGFTATPIREDGRLMGNVYQTLEVIVGYEDLIKQGFVSAPLCYGGSDLDLSGIAMAGGDYDETQLGSMMQDRTLIGKALDHWQRLAHRHRTPNGGFVDGEYRRTIIFAVTIAHSMAVCDEFSAAGIRIAHLDGNTPETERKRIIKALGCGELQAVTNVGILLEGTDIPSAKCIVHLRPTFSLVIWRQSCGREFRPWNNIEPLLLDHAGNIARHGFPHEDLHWSLTEKPRPIEKKIATRLCPACFAYVKAFQRLCPYCGHEAPVAPISDLPKESEAILQQMVSTPQEMRLMFFNMISNLAKQKGYKPGFAGARYKQRYGTWPPWEWSESLKSTFASDPEWQANFTKNMQRKEKNLIEKQAKELAKIEEEHPNEDE